MNKNLSKIKARIKYVDDPKSNTVPKGAEQELHEFIIAIEEKIRLATSEGNSYLVHVLEKIRKSMIDVSVAFEEKQVEFFSAYEEITNLYVFSELYLDIEEVNEQEIDFVNTSQED